MGKKKGKQKGQYSSKARNAAYQFEVSEGVSNVHQEWGKRRKADARSSNNKSSSQQSELQKLRNERGSVSLSLLRGMLQERIIDDRQRDASFRRQVMTTSVKARQCTNRGDTRVNTDMIGWVLTYDHREAIAGIDQQKEKAFETILLDDQNDNSNFGVATRDRNIPTLQSSCIKVVALYLQKYIKSDL